MRKIIIFIGLLLLVMISIVVAQESKEDLDLRCYQEVKGIGICEGMDRGYQYNQETRKCEAKEVSGCGADSPFDSLDECQEVCMQEKEIVECPVDCICDNQGNIMECQETAVQCPIDCTCDSEGNVLNCFKQNLAVGDEFDLSILKRINKVVFRVEKLSDPICEKEPCGEAKIGIDSESMTIKEGRTIESHNVRIRLAEVKGNKADFEFSIILPSRPTREVEAKQCPVGCTCEGDEITCPVVEKPAIPELIEEAEPVPEERECPVGCTCTEDEITCKAKEVIAAEGCMMGCKLNDKCVIQGTRIKINEVNSYCDLDSEWKTQKEENVDCQNNYECKTNFCSNNKCYDITKEVKETRGIVEKILDWLKSLFGFGK